MMFGFSFRGTVLSVFPSSQRSTISEQLEGINLLVHRVWALIAGTP